MGQFTVKFSFFKKNYRNQLKRRFDSKIKVVLPLENKCFELKRAKLESYKRRQDLKPCRR
ncbi:MAG: hypothetical protein RL329_2631 [Bacteroidota bacterium]|jgi:hypothetical protein